MALLENTRRALRRHGLPFRHQQQRPGRRSEIKSATGAQKQTLRKESDDDRVGDVVSRVVNTVGPAAFRRAAASRILLLLHDRRLAHCALQLLVVAQCAILLGHSGRG